MKTSPIVGLTLNYRDPIRTVDCVVSILNDDIKHVLIWDNSEDGGLSSNQIRSMLPEESHITIEVSHINLGFAAGVNQGLKWIRTHYPGARVLLINNDAHLLIGASGALFSALEENIEAVLAYPSINHGGKPRGTIFYNSYLALLTNQNSLPGSFPFSSGCCQMIALDRYEGDLYDEDFFMYGEDTELGFRLGETRMVHVPDVWVCHEGSASSGIATSFYESRMVAAHWLIAQKIAVNRYHLFILYGCRVVMLLARSFLRGCRYRSWIPVRSLWIGWRIAHSHQRLASRP